VIRHPHRAAVGLIAALIAGPTIPADAAGDPSIVYSDTYLRLIREFPRGWAGNACEITVFLAGGGGVCTTEVEPAYFYPDGTIGKMAWFADPNSPTGWSIEPDPCIGLSDDDYGLWASYVDFTNGYLDAGPALTGEQIDQYGRCWGWWF
jgi:hypothetical protein